MIIYGFNPVIEALRAGRVRRLRVGARADKRTDEVVALAKRSGVAIERTDAAALERLARGGVHQGIVAELAPARDYSIQELIERAAPAAPLLIVLDGIEDPHNLGAILRTADAAGVDGVIRQARRSAPLDGAVGKTSAGAVAHLKIATVVNVTRAIEEIKEAGVWTVGLASDGAAPYDQIDLTVPTAIVVGAEGTGLRRLVREACDHVAAIPMAGRVSSLNVSVAAAIVLFEAVRQRGR